MIQVPIHITGFFFPVLRENVHHTGSLGAGFSLSEYVQTWTTKREDDRVRVFFHGQPATLKAITSKEAAREFFTQANLRGGVNIYHRLEVPISCGLATSGAGALGVAFSLNKMFETSFSKEELATIAHIAEVKQKTGLGSVIAQYRGKFEIRTKAGSPQIGEVKRIACDAKCAVLVYGRIKTQQVLGSKQKVQKVKQAFGKKHTKLAENFSIKRFTTFSFQFAEKSGLLTPFLRKLLEQAKNIGLHGSMLMLGQGVFLFGHNLEEKVRTLIEKTSEKPKALIIRDICNTGVREVS